MVFSIIKKRHLLRNCFMNAKGLGFRLSHPCSHCQCRVRDTEGEPENQAAPPRFPHPQHQQTSLSFMASRHVSGDNSPSAHCRHSNPSRPAFMKTVSEQNNGPRGTGLLSSLIAPDTFFKKKKKKKTTTKKCGDRIVEWCWSQFPSWKDR